MSSNHLWTAVRNEAAYLVENRRAWAQLGDAVIGVVIAEYIVARELTAEDYAQLRSNKYLRKCAREHGVIFPSKINRHTAGTIVEAAVGRVYDRWGLAIARDEVRRYLKLEDAVRLTADA